MLLKQETATNPDLQKWLARNGVENAYEKWQNATTSRQAFLAFVAIAADQELLLRISKSDAQALTNDAGIALGNFLLDRDPNSPSRSITSLVQQRIELWLRRSILENDRVQRPLYLPPAPKDTSAALSIMVNNFPQIRPESARFAVETTLKIGVEGMASMDTKAASALALGAARVAVRSAEGRTLGFPMSRRDIFHVVRIVQDWSFAAENSPFQVQEYPEQIDLIKCVASLALDAHACVNLVAQLPGGCTAPGYTMWEEADETFGYALLRFRRFLFETLERRTAMAIASAGGRLANRAINDPGTHLPVLPDQPDLLMSDDPHAEVVGLVATAFRLR